MKKRRRGGGKTNKSFTEINMTPLLDLTFLLLIAFIITFPALNQGISVKLPRANADPLPMQKVSQTISVDAQGGVFYNKNPITLEGLSAALEQLAQEDPDATILIRGDETIAYGKIIEVIKRVKRTRLNRIALVSESE